jgi:hypothetical protein
MASAHTARLSLSKLRAHLGDDFPLIKIRERLKCPTCNSRQVTITFLGPHQKGKKSDATGKYFYASWIGLSAFSQVPSD